MDRIQLPQRHNLSHRHRGQLQDRWVRIIPYIRNCSALNLIYRPLFVSFIPGIMQQDNAEQVILDPKIIAKNYLKTWFFLDLISSIPLDYIFLIFNQVTIMDDLLLWFHCVHFVVAFSSSSSSFSVFNVGGTISPVNCFVCYPVSVVKEIEGGRCNPYPLQSLQSPPTDGNLFQSRAISDIK